MSETQVDLLREQLEQVLAEKAILEQKFRVVSLTIKEEAHVHKISVTLPPFWPDKPAVWFAQVEAQLELAGIVSDTTMYNHVVGQIDHKLANEIEDIITHPPEKGFRYSILKTELIKRLSMSEEQNRP